jgi:hypothetical protein
VNVTLIVALAAVTLTGLCVFGLGWEVRSWVADRQDCARQDADRAALAAPCDRPVPYRLSVAGLLEVPDWAAGPPFAGAADPGQQIFDPLGALLRADRLALLSDAMGIVERQHDTAEVAREVDAIFAEVESDPDRWRHQ